MSALLLVAFAGLGGQVLAHAAVPLRGTYFQGSYTNKGGTRFYEGYVPPSYRAGQPLPLVVALHGCTETADTFRELTGLDRLAQARHFIVVYPQQSRTANFLRCWNWFLPSDIKRDSTEPSIIAGITQWVEAHYSVDRSRVYIMGFSAGAAMAVVMGATYPDLYAAIGVGSGLEYGGLPSPNPTRAGLEAYFAMGYHARPMPVLIFQGGKDPIVPVYNAEKLVRQWRTTDDLARMGYVPTSPTRTMQTRTPRGTSYTVTEYDDRQGQDILQYWLVPDMAHAWSGGCGCASYADPSGPDETRVMYDFLVTHSLPSSARGMWDFAWLPHFAGHSQGIADRHPLSLGCIVDRQRPGVARIGACTRR
jgi:poly(hydroxyalkanoate) depolymerase family esterase